MQVSLTEMVFWIHYVTVLAAIEVKIGGLFHGPENGDVPYTVQAETVQPGIPNVPSHTRGVPDEQRLLRHLFHGYERTVRPVRNASTPVVIRMGLTLTQIFDMDEKDQVLVTNVWLDQEWEDEFMIWNPSDFANITTLRVPCTKLWLPDIVLYNNAAEYSDGMMPANAMVRFDGNVFWPIPTKLQSSCKVDVTYFPFDIQTCKMKFGSWTYDGFQVDITNRTQEVDLSNYVNNGEWELLSIKIVRNVVTYACCIEPFPDVTFYIVIRRRTLYYMYNVIFPCTMMSALTLLVFCLPPDSGEKIALGITVLLAFSVFMLAVAENLPETSEFVPLISIYLTIVMGLTSMSVIMTVFVLNLHHRGPNKRQVPRWMKDNLVNRLAPYLCLHEDDSYTERVINNEERFMKNVTLKITLDNIQQALENETQMERSRQANIHNGPTFQEKAGQYVTISEKTESNSSAPVVQTGYMIHSMPGDISPKQQVCKDTLLSVNEPSGNSYVHAHKRKPEVINVESLPNCSHNNTSHDRTENSRRSKRRSTLNKTNEEILQSLKRILDKHEKEDKNYELIQEWRRIAQCVDRILFFIFLLCTLSSTIGLLVIAPATQ